VAARRSFVDLSDYQALSGVFALECRPPITDHQRADLWDLENGEQHSLHRLLNNFPVPIDYVLVLGDAGSRDLKLDPQMNLVDTAGGTPFLRVYRRVDTILAK
jgi:hypothetical protein